LQPPSRPQPRRKSAQLSKRQDRSPRRATKLRPKAVLAVFLLVGLGLGAASFLVGPSESKSPSQPRVVDRHDDLGASRTVTGKYDRGFGWEEVRLEIKLVDVQSKDGADESVQSASKHTSRLITGRFSVRNRSAHPSDDYPELVAVDNFGRQSHSAPGQTSLNPSLEHLRVPSRGRSKGYLSLEVPAGRHVERLEIRLFGQSVKWRIDRPV
jgi:hypothetical protein